LDIIRNGETQTHRASGWKSLLPRRGSTEISKPLLRAPGLSSAVTVPVLRPLTRTETMPTSLDPKDTVDFEPYSGSSLFLNFKRSMTYSRRPGCLQRFEKISQKLATSTCQEGNTQDCGDPENKKPEKNRIFRARQ